MEEKITQEDLSVLRKHKTAKKVYALLFKEELSVKELAERIYNNKMNRHEITKWIKYFLSKKWITPVKSLKLLVEKKYTANLNPFISEFEQNEIKFIEIFSRSFWNPLRINPEEAFHEFLLEALIIKKIYLLKNKLADYQPKNDLKRYEKNKIRFWEDNSYREKFLNQIKEGGERTFEKRRKSNKKIPSMHASQDHLFMSLLIPDSIFPKLNTSHNFVGNPLFMTLHLLNN